MQQLNIDFSNKQSIERQIGTLIEYLSEGRTINFIQAREIGIGFLNSRIPNVKEKGYTQLEPYTQSMNRWGGDKLKANGNYTWDNGTKQATYRKRNMRPNPEGRNMRTVWSINTEPTLDAHFATYPQRLVEQMIKSGCPENGIVIDPFFGSGTTGIYARKVDRNFVGIELNPEYVKIAEKRLQNELGMFNPLW